MTRAARWMSPRLVRDGMTRDLGVTARAEPRISFEVMPLLTTLLAFSLDLHTLQSIWPLIDIELLLARETVPRVQICL